MGPGKTLTSDSIGNRVQDDREHYNNPHTEKKKDQKTGSILHPT